MFTIHLCKTYAEALRAAGKRAAAFGKDPADRLFAFCEDKLTMSLEKTVAESCGGGSFNVQVTTFSRFIRTYSEKTAELLSKESSAMAVKSLLLDMAEELTCFRRSAYNPGTAVTLYELIAQLKSANVRPDDLRGGMQSLSGALRGKIEDIVKVYEAYEEYVEGRGLFDSNSYLALMPELLAGGGFDGFSAMLVGFSSLTRQGVEIVKALSERMKDVDVFLLSGENGELYTNELKGLLMREIGGVLVEESKAVYSEEHECIMKNLFEPVPVGGERTETDRVFYYEALDACDEIKHVASVIRREVVGGMRYRDISVAVGNTAAYRTVIGRIFADYGIPYCLDDPRLLSTHPIARLTVSYLDVLRSGYQPKEVIRLVKNPYFCTDRGASDRFENFVLINALTAKNIKSGLYHTENPQQTYGEDWELFENERVRVLAIGRDGKTVGELVELLKGLLSFVGAEAEAKRQELALREYGDVASAAFTGQAFKKTVEVLESVGRILGDQRMSVADFRNVILSGYSACKVAVLPQLADAVYVGDYKECKYLEHGILFAAGLSGDVPFTKSDTAVLTDRDLVKLEEYDCIVEPKIKIVNRRERENVGAALLSFTGRLYLSRAVSGMDGKPLAKSRMLEGLLSSFTKNGRPLPVITAAYLQRLADERAGVYRESAAMRFNAPRPAMAEFIRGTSEYKAGARMDYTAETAYFSVLRSNLPDQARAAEEYLEKKGSVLARELKRGGELTISGDTLSATVLESYFKCPFACFMRHGLRLEDRQTGEVQRNEFGTFLHQVLDDYVNCIKEDAEGGDKRVRDKKTSDALVESILGGLLADRRFARYIETDKYRAVFELVGKEAKRVAYAIFCQLEGSSFVPVETEAAFRDGARYPAIRIKTPYGVKKINGKIDRVDRYGDYVRIIDYKTGKTHEDDESFYTGKNLQLYLYMNAFLSGGDKPAGAYYFPVSDAFEEKEYVYKLRGKTLSGEKVVVATDKTLSGGSGESRVLGASFVFSDGKASSRSKVLMDEQSFKAYLDYALMISERGATEISEGVIAASPYKDECKWCAYSSVCGFDAAHGRERKEKDVDARTITEAAEGEKNAD